MQMETIKENHIFKRAYARGGKVTGALFVLYYFPNRGSTRFGITVSKKIGKAVKRNHVRRLVRESVRSIEPDIKDGYDIVIVARSASVNASYQKVLSNVIYLHEKAGLLK